MAIKATIYKASVQFSDLDRNYYADHSLTIARHPSETDERMMVRVLAFVLNAPANNDLGTLEFGKDMWDPDEPCLIQTDLTGLTEHWIDVGQPDEKRVLRACGRAKRVTVYGFGTTTTAWWGKAAPKLARTSNLTVWQIPAEQSQQLAALAERGMNVQITIQDGMMYVEAGGQSVEVTLVCLFGVT
ncbi:MAG: hypothetical protein JWO94_687 [Verrucomicrobiaceae bacterium]|nr:hypothetical protein [Verrucomicrobiaceae bacterium]